MKYPLLTLLVAFLALPDFASHAAESVKFTEKFVEKISSYRDPFTGTTYPELVTTYTGTINATVTLPGLASRTLNDETLLTVEIGGYVFEKVVGEADVTTANSASYYSYDDSEPPRVNGSFVFRRSGNVVTLTASGVLEPEAGITVSDMLAAESDGDPSQAEKSSGEVTFRLTVDDLSVEKLLFYKATRTAQRRMLYEEQMILDTITVTGEFDTAKPTISITAPANNSRPTNDVLTVRGKAADNYSEPLVYLQAGSEPPFLVGPATGGTWSYEGLPLDYGTNAVRAWAVDSAGNTSVVAVTRFFYTTPKVFHLAVEPANGGTVTGVKNGAILEAARGYRATAKSAKGFFLERWVLVNDNSGEETPTLGPAPLDFLMPAAEVTLRAVFIPNPFLTLAGNYTGLFVADPANPPPDNDGDEFNCDLPAGALSCTVSDLGVISGQLKLAARPSDLGGPFRFTTQLFADGFGRVLISRRPPLENIEMLMSLNVTNPSAGLRFALGPDADAPNGHAFRTVANAGPCATNYTFAVLAPYLTNAAAKPAGDGAGTVVVSRAGNVTLAGNLADGTPLSFTGPLVTGGLVPVYVPLYGGKGWVIGWLACDPTAATGEHLYGELNWFKPVVPSRTDKYYTNGFCAKRSLVARHYTKPKANTLPFGWTNGFIAFLEGDLPDELHAAFTIAKGRLKFASTTNNVVLTVTPATGLAGGSFKHPVTGRSTAFKSAILQYPPAAEPGGGSENSGPDGAVAYGWFLSPRQGGGVLILPTPDED